MIVGSICIIIPMFMYGSYIGSKEVYKLKDYKELKKGLLLLESEIKYSNELISVACKKISENMEMPIKKIFYEFSEELEENIYDETYKIWEDIVEKYKEEMYFTPFELDEIKRFGQMLSSNDMELQLKNITMLIKFIEVEIKELSNTSFKKVKLYKTISILCGLLIIIILV